MENMTALREKDLGATANGGRFAGKNHSTPDSVLGVRKFDPRAVASTLRRLGGRLEREYPGLMLGFQVDPGSVGLRCIVVDEEHRGTGVGTAALTAFLDRADQEGWVVTLTPSDAYGGDVMRLNGFYPRFGFVPADNLACGDTFIRMPR